VSDVKIEVLKEKPFFKVTPPKGVYNGELMVEKLQIYIETVTRIMAVDLPLLTLELQSMTPEEMKKIVADCQEEIKTLSAYRVYEVTKNSMQNTDDLAELPIVLGTLSKNLTEELLNI